MIKSSERVTVEEEIRNSHRKAYDIAMQMIPAEFKGDFEKAAEADPDFVPKMLAAIQPEWRCYLDAYKKLEALEEAEGFPAMRAYAERLDIVKAQLPSRNREMCYYPFSGTDFYWARIFPLTIFEDIAFYQQKMVNMWWGPEDYQPERMEEIIANLKKAGVITDYNALRFLSGDGELNRDDNDFNSESVTLIVKQWGIQSLAERRFGEQELRFGAIIQAGTKDEISNLDEFLNKLQYKRVFSLSGEPIVIPYAMDLENINIFVKQ